MTDAVIADRRVATRPAPHGRTFADALDITLAAGAPEALFLRLEACTLHSARIDARIAIRAAARDAATAGASSGGAATTPHLW